ncbi:TLC domain-containing protein 2-like [Haliotis cracherodii]|uniref:TLC domain-containing protein 2-like n=1 Tax=Haliotis cracherodii TaxID=6455 RepID=UPI0039EBCCA2
MAIFNDRLPDNPNLDIRYGYSMMISTILFFFIVNLVISFVGAPKSVQEDAWKWRNLLVSWVHALICSVWDLSSFILYPEMFEDLLVYSNYYQYYLVAFSTGYFTYDFLDMIYNNKIFKMWEVTLHHLAVISMFWYNMHHRVAIAFNMVALLAEVNSFWLHSRKLLQMIQMKFEHWFYKAVAFMNLVTFAIFRGASLVSITVAMCFWYQRVTALYYFSLGSAMFVMNVINPILFWRLLKSDFLRKRRPEHKAEKFAVNGHGNNNVKVMHQHVN